MDAVDVNVVALTRTSKDVVERVASVSERVSPVGDHDRRLKLHAISIARPPTRRDTLGRWRPARVLGFGSAAALVVAGAICATLIGGSTGDALAIALITLGLGTALLLIFLEVGLSEERDLTGEGAATAAPRRWTTPAAASPPAPPARLARALGARLSACPAARAKREQFARK